MEVRQDYLLVHLRTPVRSTRTPARAPAVLIPKIANLYAHLFIPYWCHPYPFWESSFYELFLLVKLLRCHLRHRPFTETVPIWRRLWVLMASCSIHRQQGSKPEAQPHFGNQNAAMLARFPILQALCRVWQAEIVSLAKIRIESGGWVRRWE